MKAKYFKKFKKNITAFESSVVKVSLARRIRYKPNTQISVVRTATGAVALYQPFAGMNRIVSVNPSSIEMELNSDEWLNFVNAIHRYIGKWVKADCKRSPRMEFLPDDYWELSVFSENPDDKISRDVTSVDGCPIDWNGFTKFMND